ncbi:MAG: Fpg/Nei family DNA glycosylase [Gemmatimonadetes bacterium]|uniref:Fpg/Nei family DNA glycosylase n=1 Tax=Candidatus Kutchimonas denitrificans TaxID=3056748 RepID=A0AAE5CCL8_9BACT|nr:Fpg/Nei family DNA glycosylase [Gemmatimonadota bacterium]NIR75825.1 Fpg/Nei family DNA glycosylase [Candidatus Kutchimonas denitrificans]NIS01993.1 Fpg/Nei family DNA glycosylase [Gemmatimonadota bacterium]NIT67797.1 Fpg/Nei family DNA glycosylase [Gemmatimonadota bacterium]NIU53784.1 formamidopyrimidine-DNA glycosylase [Gemmatimonadota bacterium]
MPELPEVALYIHALEPLILGAPLERVRMRSASLLKTFDPPIEEAEGRRVTELRNIGKRILWGLEGDLFLVFHLMIAGRFRWRDPGVALPKKRGHAAFDFPSGTLLLTEAGTQKRASLHLVRGAAALEGFDRGGIDPLAAEFSEFRRAILQQNRTLKRALTDQRIVAGIGNAHSDEILFDARLSPVRRTRQLSEEELARLYEATRASLAWWIDRLREEGGKDFPEKVTAFHPAMKVHGKYGQPCPVCGSSIQRIVYAANETNYCARCQTGGKLLRDRSLSRLLRDDWPETLEELEGA